MKRKSIFKIFAYLLGFILLIIIGIMIWAYAPNKSVSDLKEKWGYDNSQFMAIEGMNVHYRISGSGPSVVLIHGTGSSLHTWEKWTAILEKEYQVISFDLPAYGFTGANPSGDYSLELCAKVLDELVTKLGIDSFSISGNSLGGAVSWRYATLYPDKVQKMILIDPAGFPLDKAPSLPFKLAQSDFWSKLIKYFSPKFIIANSVKEVYHNDELATDEVIDRYYDMALCESNRQGFVDRIRNAKPVNSQLISTVTTPTLIMWGEEDTWIPVELAQQFKENIQGSELIIYKNTGHVPMEEIPEKTVKDAIEFLKK